MIHNCRVFSRFSSLPLDESESDHENQQAALFLELSEAAADGHPLPGAGEAERLQTGQEERSRRWLLLLRTQQRGHPTGNY